MNNDIFSYTLANHLYDVLPLTAYIRIEWPEGPPQSDKLEKIFNENHEKVFTSLFTSKFPETRNKIKFLSPTEMEVQFESGEIYDRFDATFGQDMLIDVLRQGTNMRAVGKE